MSKTISMSMSQEDQILFCTKYHCKTDQIGRVLKASILSLEHSPFWRPLCGDVGVADLVSKIKRSEQYKTSEETKADLKEIFGSYILTLKEYLDENPEIRKKLLGSEHYESAPTQ